MTQTQIHRRGNKIVVAGDLSDFHRLTATIHGAIDKAGYGDVVLDFSDCTSAFQNSMLSVCAQVMAYRGGGIDFDLVPPKEGKTARLFQNTNWAHCLDPRQFAPSTFRGYTFIPATQYNSPEQQQAAVNKILNVILGAIPDMRREDFAAFEWSVNEITDNVLVHADSPIGGLVQVSTFKKKNHVQFVVADAGVGIPKTLRSGYPELMSDTEALLEAIKEGVTRDKAIGQGNGLFGSYQICSQCGGDFTVMSGFASLVYKSKPGLEINKEKIPYKGTLVVATIDFSEPKLLEEALRFGGKKYSPVDFVETEYELNEEGEVLFLLRNEASSFGSRHAGRPVRTRLTNLMKMHSGEKIFIDFTDVPLVSSSFADEAFAKLFLEVGPVAFMQKFEFVNAMTTVQGLIDKAIAQRVSTGIAD